MDIESNAAIKIEVSDVDPEEGQDSGAKPAPRALSDGSRDETPTPTSKHSWTMEQRLTLAMLAESYKNHWEEKTSIFNRFHRSDLRRGLRRAVIVAQWNEMRSRKWFDAAASLRTLQATLSPYDRSKLVSGAGLEKTAHELGIQLSARGPNDNSNRSRMSDKHDAPGRERKRKRADPIDNAKTDFFPSDDETVSELQTVLDPTLFPKTPTKSNGKQHNKGLLTPPDSRERKITRLTANKRLAQIGFRAFTAQSQGTYSSFLGIRGELTII